jgi:hypothetical protein
MLWMPYNGMAQSPTDIHFMKSGPFKGQALVGDNRAGHVNRLILDTVDGQLQGAAIRMTGGLEAGTYRISEDAKGNIYLGGLGSGEAYWAWCRKASGFQRLTFKPDFLGSKAYIDVRTVSLARDGIVLEFTSDISADFLVPAHYRTYLFNYMKSVGPRYGGPKSDSVDANIQGIVKLSDRKILITVNGLVKESILAVEAKGQTVTSYVNGKLFMRIDNLDTNLMRKQGKFAFQLHAGNIQNTVYLKDIEVFTPTLIKGCMDPAYQEFNVNANEAEPGACKTVIPVAIETVPSRVPQVFPASSGYFRWPENRQDAKLWDIHGRQR